MTEFPLLGVTVADCFPDAPQVSKRTEVTVKYLGYPIILQENHLKVYTPDGLLLVAGRLSMQTARNVVKEHRESGRLVK